MLPIIPDGEHSFVLDHTKVLWFEDGDAPASLLDSADVVFFNGYDIFLAQSTSFLAPLLANARARRVPIVFDLSSFTLIRAYGPDRLMDGVGPLAVLMATHAESDVLRGDQPLAALASRAKLVVVKSGASGASAHTADAAWRAGVLSVRVVDTTGAGDAFDAAFLVEWLRSRNVEAALRAGNRLGAHVAGHLGAQPPLPRD
jgi:sugar/nucleoside kinase (ribokinase family)